MYLSVAFVTLLFAPTPWYFPRDGSHMTEVYALVVIAAIDIKLVGALSSFCFGETISGSRHEDITVA